MLFDISLPLALSLITAAVLLVHTKFGQRVRSLLGGKEFTTRDVVLLVVMMGVAVTVLGWTVITIPEMAIVIFFLYAYSTVLFMFTYLVVPKWYLALLAPVVFIALYFFFWNIYLLNLFAVIFAICVSVYLGSLFTWKTTTVFVILLTVMDVIQVFLTGFMKEASGKMIALQLPVLVIVPAFPSSGYVGLGLGDIFVSALLAIQIAEKYGRKWGLVSITAMGVVFLSLWTAVLNYGFGFFPATVFIIAGWLTALGIKRVYEMPIFGSREGSEPQNSLED